VRSMAATMLMVNGRKVTLRSEADTPLLWVLRDELGFTGTKYGCGKGLCGSCTVHLNGEAIRSCQLTVADLKPESQVVTIEGLSADANHPVQQAWIAESVAQCGYCQAGQMMAAAALLKSQPRPSDDDIDTAMAGNICRCGTYLRIRKAIHRAAGESKV
jgi:isoquinoline 1-oxidoreductase subunit alpha